MRLSIRAGAGLFVAAVLSGCGQATSTTEFVPPRERPNIVLILTDDMNLQALPYMPYLRRELIARGTSFTNAFVSDSVCGPSRVSILTGQYAHNHKVFDNKPPSGFRKWYRDGGERSTLATWLQDVGYSTALAGKYLNFYPRRQDRSYVPPGWTHWFGLFFPEAYYDFEMNENGRVVRFGIGAEDYQTDVLATHALALIESIPTTQPFFLQLSTFAPHAPPIPADRHQHIFPDIKPERPLSFNEEDMSDKPSWIRSLPRMDEETVESVDEWFRNRVRMLQAVDEAIAGIVALLERRGQMGNTYLVFTSDNGFQHGAHRMDHGKGDPYEESLRVPLIVRGPGVPQNRELGHYVLNIDLAPTFAELAGRIPPDWVDGRSLVPLLRPDPPEPDAWRSDFLVEHWTRDSGEGVIPEYFAVRSHEYMYVEYPTGDRELYDMKKDPGQLESLHESAEPELLERLSARLAALKACEGPSCREEPPAPTPEPSPSPSPAASPEAAATPTPTPRLKPHPSGG